MFVVVVIACSYLVLIGITFTGQLVYGSGLCRSSAYDSHIFDETKHEHPQLDLEMNIGTSPQLHVFFTPRKSAEEVT